jgi:DNA modification methylase
MTFFVHHGDCREVMATLDAESVDAVVCDPPYGLSFMGKGWDHGVPGEEFWTEALRVAKPGAHLLAFGGTRTYHRLACAIDDAGWEIRDCVMWVYGSGFPKSHDVSKAIDKMDAAEEQKARRHRFTAWVRSTGATARQIDEATGTRMGSHYTTHPTQPAIMTREHLEQCRHLLRDVPQWVEREADVRSVESKAFASREVVDTREMRDTKQVRISCAASAAGYDSTSRVVVPITAPATDAARQWSGWGTALKPAWEPIIVARKPLVGTVAENVLTHGTGAINVDGCRVSGESTVRPNNKASIGYGGSDVSFASGSDNGRWPANLIHDGSEEVVGLFPQQHSGANPSRRGSQKFRNSFGEFQGNEECVSHRGADSGSAARFFYCAKASKADRDEGCEGLAERLTMRYGEKAQGPLPQRTPSKPVPQRNHHPTVKPTALMRYLCRLVTPPGGVVLDPFTGSGSTGKAAVSEGFDFVGIEREAEYVEIARARIAAAVLPLEAIA